MTPSDQTLTHQGTKYELIIGAARWTA